MTPTSADISGRMFLLEEEGCVRVEVWHHGLEPMVLDRRSIAEWAVEYIRELDEMVLRQGLQLPLIGNFQVLFKGRISGWPCGPHNEEWDEEIDFEDEVEYEPIPADFLKYFSSATLDAGDDE